MNYITREGLESLKTYRYKGEDRSLLYKHVLSPWADFCVNHFTPRSIAPNTITFIGLLLQLLAYLMLYYNCPTFAEGAPSWTILFAAFALFAYSTLDNMDGKQARRVGASSPLGLLFDHGCDAMNTGMVGTLSFIMATGGAGGLEQGNMRIPFAFWAFLSVAFFMNTWEEYHIRQFILPVVNGPSEGLMLTTLLFIVTAFKGTTMWTAEVRSFKPLAAWLSPLVSAFRSLASMPHDAPVSNIELTAVCAGLFLALTCVFNSITVTRYYLARGTPLSTYLRSFGDTVPMWTLLFVCGRWLYDPAVAPAARAHPHLWLLAAGCIFSEFTSRLMISHVCDQVYRPSYLPIALFGLAPGLSWLSGAFPAAHATIAAWVPPQFLQPSFLLLVAFVFGATYLATFFIGSVTTIADCLDIDVFDSSKQRRRHEAAAAAALAEKQAADAKAAQAQ